MPSGLIQSLFSTRSLLPEMYRVVKNASPEFRLGEVFLATLFISENKFFVIQSPNKFGKRLSPILVFLRETHT